MTYISGILQRNIKTLPLATELHENTGAYYAPGEQLQDLARRWNKREVISPEEMPKLFFGEFIDKKLPKSLPAFGMASVYLVTDPLREILEAHNLGEGFLWDVDLYEHDRSTRHSTNINGFHIGAWKSALRGEHCPKLRRVVQDPPRWMLEGPIEDGDVVVSPEAETGADIWRDEFAPTLLFLSDRLTKAIKSAKFDKLFSPLKCTIK